MTLVSRFADSVSSLYRTPSQQEVRESVKRFQRLNVADSSSMRQPLGACRRLMALQRPTGFEVSTGDNVYMCFFIKGQVSEIQSNILVYLKQEGIFQENEPMIVKELKDFLEGLKKESNITWQKLADQVVEQLKGLTQEQQNRIKQYIMGPCLETRNSALREHNALVKTLLLANKNFVFLPPCDKSDAVFATDTGEQISDEKFLLAKLNNERRKGEEDGTKELARLLGLTIHVLAGYNIEGGDLIYNKKLNTLFVGEGFRNIGQPSEALAKRFPDVRVVGVKLINEEHYHLDCCFSALDDGQVLVLKEAISQDSLIQIEQIVGEDNILYVNKEEALKFATNVVNDVKDIIGPENSLNDKSKEVLKGWGYRMHEVGYNTMSLSGGSIRCSVLQLRIWMKDNRSNEAPARLQNICAADLWEITKPFSSKSPYI